MSLKKLLYPNLYIEKVEQITIDLLKKNNLDALILDVDNTLIDYYKNLSIEKIKWSEDLKQHGIKLYILSNTSKKEKVEKVAKKLDVPYKMFAKKPAKKGFFEIQKIFNIDFKNIEFIYSKDEFFM